MRAGGIPLAKQRQDAAIELESSAAHQYVSMCRACRNRRYSDEYATVLVAARMHDHRNCQTKLVESLVAIYRRLLSARQNCREFGCHLQATTLTCVCIGASPENWREWSCQSIGWHSWKMCTIFPAIHTHVVIIHMDRTLICPWPQYFRRYHVCTRGDSVEGIGALEVLVTDLQGRRTLGNEVTL